MKFAMFTTGLLAVSLLAIAPGSAVAGRGLLDAGCACATQKAGGCAAQKSCGCATQKGGAIVQKGAVVQKGHVHQKGAVVQKGGVIQKGCGSSTCGSCAICLPRVLPAIIHGIDTVLNRVFCCDSCGSGKGGVVQKGHVAQKGCATQKGHAVQKGCGCDSSQAVPGNPFIEDLQPPPIPDDEADARVPARRAAARPVSHLSERSTRSAITSAIATAREPRALPAELVSPMQPLRDARTSVQSRPSEVIRTSASTPSGLVVPANPLR